MKKFIIAVSVILFLFSLTACAPGEVVAEQNNPVDKPEPLLVASKITVHHHNISLTIPDDWKYEILKGKDNADYCIAFWPKDETEGRIEMTYFASFGVCGTGLKEEIITVGDYQAHQGTYGNYWLWEYICFVEDMPGSYVALNAGAEKWWNTYGEEAMEILSTLKIEEYITVDE